MSYRIPCECSNSIAVTASQAGTTTKCDCGNTLGVPSFGELEREFREIEEPIETVGSRPIAKVGLGILLVLLVSLFVSGQPPLLLLTSMLCILVGKIWLCVSMIREMGTPALLILIVPFFDWLFVLKRFDVAWKPVALQVIAFIFFVLAVRSL